MVAGGVAMLTVVGTWVAYSQLARRYEGVLVVQRRLEQEAQELRASRDQLSEELQTERQHTAQLTEALSAREAALQATVDRLAKEEQSVRELQERLTTMQRQFDLLQGELAMTLQERPAGSTATDDQMVQLEKVVVTHPTSSGVGLQGRILSVHPEWKFIVLDLGWDVVKIGDIVSIYRDNQLLAKARVERIQEEVSAATLLPDWVNVDVHINDVVRPL